VNYSLRMKRLLVGSAAGAMILATVPTGIAVADVADVCEGAPDNEFSDVADTATHKDRIDCLAAYAITSGVTPTTYEPGSPVLRGQMATFIARFISQAMNGNTTFPTNAPDRFTDDDGTTHEDAINYLADIGVVAGTTATTYSPGANVTRGQMARFIANALDYIGVDLPSNPDDAFEDDDGTTHELQINQLAELQIVTGFNDETYRPGENVTRAQMATFITGAAGAADEAGEWNGVMVHTGPTPAGVTVRPELVSAQIVSTVTSGNATSTQPAGTYVRYTFDDDVLSAGPLAPAGGSFFIHTFDNTRFTGNNANVAGAGGTRAPVVESGNRSVLVHFTTPATPAAAAGLSLATVAVGAVSDVDGNRNPEGDAAIGSGSTGTPIGQAGVTTAPDLVSVSGFRPGATATLTAVDFTFDQAATTQAFADTPNQGFALISATGVTGTDPDRIECEAPASGSLPVSGGGNASGGSGTGGQGTTTITVLCDNPGGSTTTITAASVARGVVDAGSVASTDNTPVVQQAPQAATVAPNEASAGPDLVSARFQPAATAAGQDVVIYVFDQNIALPTTPGNYGFYRSDGSIATGSAITQLSSNQREVAVTFAAIDNINESNRRAAGVFVLDDAAVGTNAVTNRVDELGVANTGTTPGTVSGRTTAPNLLSVTLDQGSDVFGQPSGYRATYTFDEAVNFLSVDPLDFYLYHADGTRLQGETCTRVAAETAAAGTAGEDQVRCTAYNRVDNAGVFIADATSAQIGSAVLGTNAQGAVTDGTNAAPEGAAFTTGGTGTPAS